MTETVECVVIGAGVVGLAVAREMALAGHETIVLEAGAAIGQETSARNSEVIHAGIYYPAGSLKARLCVAGRDLLYAYCDSHGISHNRCGKLIVATREEEVAELDGIAQRAQANGVHDLVRLSVDQVHALEPEVSCAGALLSPSTGTVDSHGLMLALQGDAEANGAMLALNSPVDDAAVSDAGIDLVVGGAHPMNLRAARVINASGLDAVAIANRIRGLGSAHIPEAWFAKGNYFRLRGRAPFKRLVYPVPEPGGLGVHVTIDLGGQARFGPDVEPVDQIDYTVDASRGARFYDAIRRYWPGLPDDVLEPDYAGIRPKLGTRDNPITDFVISGPAEHGVPGLVNLFGIESPGLTSSLAIGQLVGEILDRRSC